LGIVLGFYLEGKEERVFERDLICVQKATAGMDVAFSFYVFPHKEPPLGSLTAHAFL